MLYTYFTTIKNFIQKLLHVKVARGENSASSYKLVTLCSLSLGSQMLWGKTLRWCMVALLLEWY